MFVVEVVVRICVVTIRDPRARAAYADGGGITCCQVTAAIDFADLHITGRCSTLVDGELIARAGDGTVDVASCEDLADGTARDGNRRVAVDVCHFVAMTMVVLIHVKAGLVAVTAAEHPACDDTAIDVHIRAIDVSCVTAAIDITAD